MNHKAKMYEMEHKQRAMQMLAAHISLLEARGMKPEQWTKEANIRKLRADIRRADARLRRIDASEKLDADKVQRKQEKVGAAKQAKESGHSRSAEKKEAKPAKKEKKAKTASPMPQADE